MKLRRNIFKLVLFLLVLCVGGAIINVTVAWGTGTFLDPFHNQWQFGEVTEQGRFWRVWRWDRPGMTYLLSQRGEIPSNSHRMIGSDPMNLARRFTDLILSANPHNIETRDVQASGWPSLALRHVTLIESPHAATKSLGALDIGLSTRTLPWPSPIKPPHYLSTQPIVAGFAINTIFYAAVLWMLFALPGAVRRRIVVGGRIKRGLCASCGYSLRGRDITSEKCPECGCSSPSPSGRGPG